jgi:hypothetical protein
MVTLEQDLVSVYLGDLLTLVSRASHEPLTMTKERAGVCQVRTGSVRRPLATFTRYGDAALFVTAVTDLRALATAVAELLAMHHGDDRGLCVDCAQRSPCQTRRLINAELAPRATA